MSNSIIEPPHHATAAVARLKRRKAEPRARPLASLLAALVAAWRNRRRREKPLSHLSDHLLRDIGLTREGIERKWRQG